MLMGERSASRSRRFFSHASSVHVKFFGVPNDGRLLRRHFKKESERIGVQLDVAVRVANLKFVMRALPHARNENFPHAGRAQQPHGMATPVPMVEVANDADALRIGRPDGEARAGHAVNHTQLRAELVVNFPLVALAEQIQIRLAQRGQKRIGIARAPLVALRIRDHKVVGINRIRQIGDALENIGFGNPLQLECGSVHFMHRFDRDFFCAGLECAHDQARAVTERVHAQKRVRRLMGQVNQAP